MQLYQEIQIAKKNAKRIINQAKLNGQRQHKNQNTETDYEENQNTTGPNNFITQYPDAKYYINPPQKSSQTLLQQQQQQSNKNLTKIEQLRQNDTYQKKQRQRPISAAILSIKEEVKVHREMMNDPKFNTLMKKKTAQKLDTGIKGSMRRISSAQTNFHLKQNQSQNKTLVTKNSQPNLLKLRPQTALSNQKFPQNQLTQTQSVKNVVNSVKQNYDAWNLKKTQSPPNTINIYSLDKEKEIADNSKGWNFSSKLYKPSNIVKTKMQRKTSMDDLNLKNSALFFDDVLDDKISQWESRQDTNEKLEVFVPYGNVKQTNYHVNVPWSASTRNVSTYK
ncbi:hypothetical protein PPERSA_07684 [Pseudocohnilembus persalinus]|uniref:Uncharacterized protein n=1 Tax=Pseudocohnilembus persalinus TaxID=266149 RepID=A0A0V0QIN8_PSEPJ|nr:hypothetical protein PPERSA_07684 [Pseudocohnilembus persalinus]|eukprot:KRX02039.1 hypothetical protein PPERSA_07684 [Pseudocohnilembus persalinus]